MRQGIAGRVAKAFIDSKLTPLLMLSALLIGTFATLLTPREEEPQIVVPLVDIFVPYPGASPAEVEERISKPLEKIISEIHGVEYVYSTSMPDMALITVRYLVGENTEESLVKLWSVIMKNMDKVPSQQSFPLIKAKAIDDVPILTLTLWSETYDGYGLRRLAAQLSDELKDILDVSEIEMMGGQRRQVRVVLDQARLRAYNLDPLLIAQQIQAANQSMTAGHFQSLNQDFIVETGDFLKTVEDVQNLVVGVSGSNPIYLANVADVIDGPEEVSNYTFFGLGKAGLEQAAVQVSNSPLRSEYPAVTLAVAKRKGADAMSVAERVLKKVERLKGRLIPADVHLSETRNYGKTASDKVTTLLEHLFGAILAVTIVVSIFLGWRGGIVVFASVPVTFAMTLFIYYLFGYTLNRVTLFALIFVTGIVVDDSIIIAENIHRHFSIRKLPPLQAAIAAINEVGNPTILATFTVIAAVLPMAFVSGLMGPYMSPMPIGAAMAMLFSLLVALIATPWLAYRLLKQDDKEEEYDLESSRTFKLYNKTLSPLVEDPKKAWLAIGASVALLLLAMAFVPLKLVEVKMLPFDNKSEFQVIIDMPESATLEQTAAVTKDIAAYLRTEPEVRDYQYYVGANAPINFNGLVRHYYLRRSHNMADIQVNLVDKSDRSQQSHDIARRVRPRVQEIARKYNARVKIAEVPPGPPVLSTLVAEIYGPDYEQQIEAARKVRDIFDETEGVVDVDWLVEDDQVSYAMQVDKAKAAITGVSTQQIANALALALHGSDVGLLHDEHEIEPVGIQLRLGQANRTSIEQIGNLSVRAQSGQLIPISDLVTVDKRLEDKSIFRKNLKRVVYVTGDVAGEVESPVYAMLDMDEKIEALQLPNGVSMSPNYTSAPFSEEEITMKWDGEWQITLEVFRDLGGAFAVVLVIIYLLIIGWFQSFKTPLVMMVAIPLSMVGIIPGHFLHGAFFTATSMIGMIALAGIMVRNSVLIIDFIHLRTAEGVALKQAVIESGAVRTRPILLTAGTVVIGAIVILFDPIFQGLAISLMWGAIASTVLTLGLVPLIYYMVAAHEA